jgi:hypothetical protein
MQFNAEYVLRKQQSVTMFLDLGNEMDAYLCRHVLIQEILDGFRLNLV